MYRKELHIPRRNASAIIISSLLPIAGLFLAAEAFGFPLASAQQQNATASANQTGSSVQNQTAMMGNLTSTNFDIVQGDFSNAREALLDNNTQAAYAALTFADSDLFSISNSQGSQIGSTIEQQFVPLRDQLEQSENALLGNDTMKAFDGLNAASVELLKLTQKLPPGEEPEGD